MGESPVVELDSGGIANYQLEENQPVWLRLTTSDSTITGYLSTDGKNFTKLTEKMTANTNLVGLAYKLPLLSYLNRSNSINKFVII